jgi:uncharacterized protein YhhL (DUF1145 family)
MYFPWPQYLQIHYCSSTTVQTPRQQRQQQMYIFVFGFVHVLNKIKFAEAASNKILCE